MRIKPFILFYYFTCRYAPVLADVHDAHPHQLRGVYCPQVIAHNGKPTYYFGDYNGEENIILSGFSPEYIHPIDLILLATSSSSAMGIIAWPRAGEEPNNLSHQKVVIVSNGVEMIDLYPNAIYDSSVCTQQEWEFFVEHLKCTNLHCLHP